MEMPNEFTPGQRMMTLVGWTPAETIRHRDWIEIRWIDPLTGKVESQPHALRIVRERQRQGQGPKKAHASIS